MALPLTELQNQIRTLGLSWTAAETTNSHHTLVQAKRRTGYVPGPNNHSLEEAERIAREPRAVVARKQAPEAGSRELPLQQQRSSGAPQPVSFDWRNVAGKNYTGAVREQGGCGSCVAFGVIAALECRVRIDCNDPANPVDLSEGQLFFCYGPSHGAGKCPDGGWNPDAAYEALKQGIVTEGCFPYTGIDQACNLCVNWENQNTKITGWRKLTDRGEMKAFVSNVAPATACFTVYEDFHSYYAGGVYSYHSATSGSAVGGHCVCVVGYDDNLGCWICKNSWGSGWGDGGFFKMSYGNCGLDATMWVSDGLVQTGYFSKWYKNNDGAKNMSADFTYTAPRYLGGAPGLSGANIIPCDFNGDRKTDIVVFRSSDGYFDKLYARNDGTGNMSPDFNAAAPRYIGGTPKALSGAQLIPCDFNGDGKTDFLVFRPSDGYFAKWYGKNDGAGNMSPDFNYSAARYIGGAPNALSGAQLTPCDFNGDGTTDFLVFRSSDGYFAKWYSKNDGSGSMSPDFNYTAARYIGGAPNALSGAQLIPCHFRAGKATDFLVFRSSDGYFGKWYSKNDGPGNMSPDFNYTAARYIGGAPSALSNARLIRCDFNANGQTDILVFRSSDGYFAKWYSKNDEAGKMSADFNYTAARYIGGTPNALPGAQLISCDFTGDGTTDILVFRPSDGYFGKWYSKNDEAGKSPDFNYTAARYIGGAAGSLPFARLIPCDFDGDGKTDILVYFA